MLTWKNDDELFALMKKDLYSAVIGDILDQMGHYHQFLPMAVQPIREDMVVCGRAMTVKEEDLPVIGEPIPTEPTFGHMLDALDDLKKNEVYLCSGSSPDYAVVGELMCTRMQVLGAAGTVMNGPHRDTKGILALDFPCFSRGRYSQDQAPRGRVTAWRVPIEIEGTHVDSGDIVFGDMDGVVIIPQSIEKEVIERAWEKATGEKTVGKAIQAGMSATEAFRKYGIL
ncbi:MAG: RraA family protein [Christensenellales bacterium]|jgi:regulator of RNase E activity RraA